MTRYFRVAPIVERDGAEVTADHGYPAVVTRNHQYHPDENGMIAVADSSPDGRDDADAFARERGYAEVIIASAEELPAPPATHERRIASRATSRSAASAGTNEGDES